MGNATYAASALTGGGTGALDKIPSAGLVNTDLVIVQVLGDAVYHYEYIASSAAAESSPNIIKPDDNAGNGRWIRQATFGFDGRQIFHISTDTDYSSIGLPNNAVIHADTTAGEVTVTIEDTSTSNDGGELSFTNDGENHLHVVTVGGQDIGLTPTISIMEEGKGVKVLYDHTDGHLHLTQDSRTDASNVELQFLLSGTASSDLTPIRQLAASLEAGSVDVTTQALSVATTELSETNGQWITEPLFPGIALLSTGVFALKLSARISAGSKDTIFRAAIYKYETDTTETLLVTTEDSPILTGAVTGYTLDGILSVDTILDPTDRLLIKITAVYSGGGANPTIELTCEGTTTARLGVPAPTTAFPSGNGGSVLGLAGVNEEALSAGKTLTANTSVIHQRLDTQNTNRIITLDDTGAVEGNIFKIKNISTENDSAYLDIKNHDAGILQYVYSGGQAEYVFDGTNWKAADVFSGGGTFDEQENVQIGFRAKAYNGGAALGAFAIGVDSGAAIGKLSVGNNFGVAVGKSSTGSNSTIAIGANADTTEKLYSAALGYNSDVLRTGETSFNISGLTQNDFMRGSVGYAEKTANATPVEMFLGDVSNQRLTVPVGSSMVFYGEIVARDPVAVHTARWTISGTIQNEVGVTTLLESTVTEVLDQSGDWAVTVAADNGNDALAITVTGDGTNATWFAGQLHIVEVRF